MMKILYVAPFGLGQKSTVWARILPLAQQMVQRGAEATILIPPWDTPGDAGRRWVQDGVRLVNVSLGGGLPGTVARMLAHIRQEAPDIIHIVKPRAYAGIVQWLLWHAGMAPSFLRKGFFGKRGTKPRLFLDVDDWEQAWSAIGGYGPITASFLDWQERWGLSHAHAITAASRWLTDHVQTHTPHIPVLYLPNGILPPTGEPNSVAAKTVFPSSPTVLLFSRFVEVEPAWMGAFWRHLRQMHPDVSLLVGGRGLQPQREAAFRAALGDETANVRWLGYVPPTELETLYAHAACAIFPAANLPLNQAKCSVRLANTLLRGVPVVASAVGEQAAYGAHGAAHLVPPDATPAEFAGAVAQLLADPERRNALTEQARARLLTDYSWQSLGERLWRYYLTT